MNAGLLILLVGLGAAVAALASMVAVYRQGFTRGRAAELARLRGEWLRGARVRVEYELLTGSRLDDPAIALEALEHLER